MANVATFPTRALFDTSLAYTSAATFSSGGVDYPAIGYLMSNVSSAAPSVSIVAHITESGETFNCGTNIMYDIKSAGPGDYIVYDSTNGKYFAIAQKWIDNNYPSQPTQKICKVSTGVLPARYVVCGTVVWKRGKNLRIAGMPASKAWSKADSSDYAWAVATLTNYTTTVKESGTTTTTFNTNAYVVFPSRRYQEDYYTANRNTSWLPCTRAEWNAAIIAMGHTPSSTITIASQTVNPADYDYDYDKFISYHYQPMKFPSSGSWCDMDGKENTRKIVTAYVDTLSKFSADTNDSYAAGYCYNYAVSAPGLGKHQWYLGTIRQVGDIRALSHTLLSPISWRSGYLWSSTQSSAYHALYVGGDGYVDNGGKYYGLTAVPFSDLILS